MEFQQLQARTTALAGQAYRPGMTANHVRQADIFIRFCGNYGLHFIGTAPSTLAYYITYLSSIFTSPKSMRNYVSRAPFLHKHLDLAPEAFDSIQVHSLLCAADLTMRIPPLRHFPILSLLLTQLCQLLSSLGSLGPSMRLCFIFGFLEMLRQSNLALPSASAFEPTRHSCRGDVILATQGILLIVQWTKSIQVMGRTPVLLIPTIPDHPDNPVGGAGVSAPSYLLIHHLFQPTPSHLHHQVNDHHSNCQNVVHGSSDNAPGTQVGLQTVLLSQFWRGGATPVYRQGAQQFAIKMHGLWASESFWDNITATCV